MTKLPSKPKRKRYSDEFKEFLVQEAMSSGRSIASIARDNVINQNLLHNWKHQNKKAQTATLPATVSSEQSGSHFIPIILEQTEQTQPNYNQAPSLTTVEQTTATAIINDIQLQIPSGIAPIHLHIASIDTQNLIELLRGLQ